MDPRAEYERRLSERRAEVERLGRHDRALSTARLAMFLTFGVVLYMGLGPGVWPAWVAAAPGALFAALVAWHARALARRRRMERAARHYARGLARLDGSWPGQGQTGERFDAPEHPYARDLDLFGRGSLFELLCTTRTHAGEEALAAWLLAPAPVGEVRARQAAVAELRDRVALREALELLGEDVRAEVDPAALRAWAAQPARLEQRWLLPLLALLAAAAAVTLVGWLGLAWGWSPFVGVVLVEMAVMRLLREPLGAVTSAVDRPGQHLAVLAGVLERMEREPAESAKLKALKGALVSEGQPASARIARLGELVGQLLAARNQFFAPLAYVLMWAPIHACLIERWRRRSGGDVPRWLDAVGELEALCALAGYAYEHPADPFAELVEEGPRLEGVRLGHPLIPEAKVVRNDVRLGGELRLLLVSGSNMSGKSTLLRTVGTNVVLALAGAPVRAERLVLSPLQVGATLRIQDSLAEGASRFWAEITRLRQLVDLAGRQPPLLFLLDEILAGTNSHDRRLGAEAVVRGLIARGALGLVTTHDLALAEMAEAMAARAANVHFEDTLEDGRLVFDYKMRPGVVQRSNALALMRAVGLEV